MEWATLPLKKYAEFNGRARRKEFWSFWLLTLAAYVAAAIVDGVLGMSGLLFGVYGPLTILVMLALICPSIAVSVRRMHDTGKSGWWLLIALVPFLGALALLFFYLQEGQRGSNTYGPDPKFGEIAAARTA